MPNPIKNPPKSPLDAIYCEYIKAGMSPAEARSKICTALDISESHFYALRASGKMTRARLALLHALRASGDL